jgi:uncharacterized protein YpuA (DUF1002 family)
MPLVLLNDKLAEDLIESKIKVLNKSLESILDKYNYDDAGQFLNDVQHEIIEKGKEDAAKVRDYLKEIFNLIKIKDSFEYYEED